MKAQIQLKYFGGNEVSLEEFVFFSYFIVKAGSRARVLGNLDLTVGRNISFLFTYIALDTYPLLHQR